MQFKSSIKNAISRERQLFEPNLIQYFGGLSS